MGVAFTPAERERISELMLDSGQRLFSAQGLHKTSLAELIARPASPPPVSTPSSSAPLLDV